MKVKYHIEGLDCPHCAARLEGMLAATEGIISAKINFLTEKITVESDLAESALDALVARVAAAFDKNTAVSRM
jgi:copper chaperone CopZ